MNQHLFVTENQSDKLILHSVRVEPDPEFPRNVTPVKPTSTIDP